MALGRCHPTWQVVHRRGAERERAVLRRARTGGPGPSWLFGKRPLFSACTARVQARASCLSSGWGLSSLCLHFPEGRDAAPGETHSPGARRAPHLWALLPQQTRRPRGSCWGVGLTPELAHRTSSLSLATWVVLYPPHPGFCRGCVIPGKPQDLPCADDLGGAHGTPGAWHHLPDRTRVLLTTTLPPSKSCLLPKHGSPLRAWRWDTA